MDVDLTPQEQSLFRAIETRLPLDSLNRHISREMSLSYPFRSYLDYSVDLYSSLDSLSQETMEEVTSSILEFVMTQPIKEGRIIMYSIYFYKRGNEYREKAFVYQITKDGYEIW
jgi:hypothetical protein